MPPPFKSSHPLLVWPRSDGDSSTWPKEGPVGNPTGWFEKLPFDHAKYKLYRTKIGAYLASEVYQLPGHVSKGAFIDMPSGYALFIFYKPQEGRSVREDTYLFGSTMVNKFRATPEFEEHARWLMDTSLPLDDHSQCGCRYNAKSDIAKAKRAASAANVGGLGGAGSTGGAGPSKKRSTSVDREPKRPRNTEMDDYDGVVTERAIDIRTKRRFRKGELVFFRIKTIPAPSGTNLPDITHWPGLVSSVTAKSNVVRNGTDAAASASVAWSMAGGAAPTTLQKETVEVSYRHAIRALGMFSNSYEVTDVGTADILPWAVGPELLGGPEGWDKIGQESERTLLEGVKREAELDAPKAEDLSGPKLEERWKRRWGERIKFPDMPANWEAAVLRLGVAIRTAKKIAGSWSQTDKIEVVPHNSIMSAEDVEAIQNRRKTLFQGLWLQGERIWLDDMVILRKHRSSLPVGPLLAPSPGSEKRAVFLHIRCICLEIYQDEQPATQVDADNWRCLLYGDIYELSSSPVDGQPELPVKPPADLYFRRLNDSSSEVTLDVFDVVNRTYPDLLEKDAGYFCSPTTTDRKGRVPAGEHVSGLLGLHPGSDVEAYATVWKGKDRLLSLLKLTPDDLYVMVRDATSMAEQQVREHYANCLRVALGYPLPSPTSTQNPTQKSNGGT